MWRWRVISGAPPRVKARLLHHTAVKFPAAVRAEILRVAEQTSDYRGGAEPAEFSAGRIFRGGCGDGVQEISSAACVGGFDWEPRADDFSSG